MLQLDDMGSFGVRDGADLLSGLMVATDSYLAQQSGGEHGTDGGFGCFYHSKKETCN